LKKSKTNGKKKYLWKKTIRKEKKLGKKPKKKKHYINPQ
jgi:hypothetical protein